MESSVGPAFIRINSASNSLPSRDVLISRVIAPFSQIQDQPLTLTTASLREAPVLLGLNPGKSGQGFLDELQALVKFILANGPVIPLVVHHDSH